MTEEHGPLSFGPDEDEDEAAAAGPGATAEETVPPVPPPARPVGAFRYGWVVGLAFLVVIALVTINTLRTPGVGSKGLKEGEPLPPFAMPLALSDLDGDANIADQPNQEQRGKHPACTQRGRKILNSCELAEHRPLVLAFFASRAGSGCARELDRLDRARRRHPDIQFAAVAIRGDRSDLRTQIRNRGWRFPVGYDRDGAVSTLYRIVVCPTVIFAKQGGITLRTTVGELDDRELERELAALRRAAP
jgi:peroxiredoxin